MRLPGNLNFTPTLKLTIVLISTNYIINHKILEERKKKNPHRYRIIHDNRSCCNAIIDTTSAILTMQLKKILNDDICISPRFNYFNFSDIFHIKSIEGIHF